MIDLNPIIFSKLERIYDVKIYNRAKVYTGSFCNYKCKFCYYKHGLNNRRPFEDICKDIDSLEIFGITELDFSGGESSIEPNWFRILEYCSDRFNNLSTLSNGSSFYSMDFLKESHKRGLKEILFSIHGDEKTHDGIVGTPGAYYKLMRSIDNAKSLDMVVRINSTVYDGNYKILYTFIDMLNNIKPLQINFLTLNYWDDNAKMHNDVTYADLTDSIKQVIDNIDIKYINVRYTPYCFMQGYERHVCNTYQHIYDIYDWFACGLTPDEWKGIDISRQNSNKEKVDFLYNLMGDCRNHAYKKPMKCVYCKYLYICDGIEKVLNEDVYPIEGEHITNPLEFRRDFYENN